MSLITHAYYLIWASKAVAAANEQWRRLPFGDSLGVMDEGGLHHWLFRWGIETERIEDPGLKQKGPHSLYVSRIFDAEPNAVKQEARRYWRIKMDERTYSERES